jgi:hypothetical protein
MSTLQFRRKVRKFETKLQCFEMSALVLMSVWPSFALAQDSHSHTALSTTGIDCGAEEPAKHPHQDGPGVDRAF